MAIYRLTGVVQSIRHKDWTKDDRSGTLHFATVAVNEFVRSEVTVPENLLSGVVEGAAVDLIVDVYQSGGYLRCQANGYWPQESTSGRRAA